MSYEKERGGGGGQGVFVFADGIIGRQKGEENREMNSGSEDSQKEFLSRFIHLFVSDKLDKFHFTGLGPREGNPNCSRVTLPGKKCSPHLNH